MTPRPGPAAPFLSALSMAFAAAEISQISAVMAAWRFLGDCWLDFFGGEVGSVLSGCSFRTFVEERVSTETNCNMGSPKNVGHGSSFGNEHANSWSPPGSFWRAWGAPQRGSSWDFIHGLVRDLKPLAKNNASNTLTKTKTANIIKHQETMVIIDCEVSLQPSFGTQNCLNIIGWATASTAQTGIPTSNKPSWSWWIWCSLSLSLSDITRILVLSWHTHHPSVSNWLVPPLANPASCCRGAAASSAASDHSCGHREAAAFLSILHSYNLGKRAGYKTYQNMHRSLESSSHLESFRII